MYVYVNLKLLRVTLRKVGVFDMLNTVNHVILLISHLIDNTNNRTQYENKLYISERLLENYMPLYQFN